MRIRCTVGLDASAPEYASSGSAGADLRAAVREPMIIEPGRRAMVPTGLRVQIPEGYEAQIRPRSGLALRLGVTVVNAPGTVDSDYRGEVCVLLINLGSDPFVVRSGDRVAQLVVSPVVRADFVVVEELEPTVRGEGGFGSTGS